MDALNALNPFAIEYNNERLLRYSEIEYDQDVELTYYMVSYKPTAESQPKIYGISYKSINHAAILVNRKLLELKIII